MMKYILSASLLLVSSAFASDSQPASPSLPTSSSRGSRFALPDLNLSDIAGHPKKVGVEVLLLEAGIECLNKKYGSRIFSKGGFDILRISDLVHTAKSVGFAAISERNPKKLAKHAVKVFAREKTLQGATLVTDKALKHVGLPTTQEVKSKTTAGRFAVTAAEYYARYGIDLAIAAVLSKITQK